MCGRSTYKLTWEEIVALYRLTLEQPPVNTRARYNVCPTMTIDTITGQNGERRLVPMRWGLVPFWWSKPLKELKLATFNARAETVAEKPMFRGPFKSRRCLIPVSGWRDKSNGETLKSCAMIITEPNEFVAEVHDRMRKKISSRG